MPTVCGTEKSNDMTSKDYYFDSYAHFGIHEEMLKDSVRTDSYKNAIMKNSHLFKDKVVLDVGCGTGILSMFAAKAGAKLVIGVDMSNIIDQAKVIVKDNGFEGKIVLLKGKMEEVELPVPKVDIIISEWMGYFLLYESMLQTVLYARDRYLSPNGLIFPDKATMHLAAIEDAEYKEEKINFWDNVYGFNYSSIKSLALHEALVDWVNGDKVVTDVAMFKSLDLYTCTEEDLTFSVPFTLNAKCDDYAHAFVSWFDIEFSAGPKPIRFSTGPFSKDTHWRQTVFYVNDTMAMAQDEKISGTISVAPNKSNKRDLDVSISFNLDGKHSKISESNHYKMC